MHFLMVLEDRSLDQGVSEVCSFRGLSLQLADSHLLLRLLCTHTPGVSSPLYKDTSHIGFRATLTASFECNHLNLKARISK